MLKEKAARGEIILVYSDETGFDGVHNNQYAWAKQGERHLIEGCRGGRLNVIGAMVSTGKFYMKKIWQTVDGDLFAGFVGGLVEFIKDGEKEITIVLDNASFHRGKKMKQVIEFFKKQGVNFYFLPPYSPELNKIERLWHKIKYTWMRAKRRTKRELENDVGYIIDRLGLDGYKFAF